MAITTHSLLTLFITLNLILSFTPHAFATRDIQSSSKIVDKKQPENFVSYDGTVLIPGIGRVVVPKVHKGFNPFTYNPVTGTGGGAGTPVPGGSGGGGSTPSYVPGGDDTLVPNPGFEVPVPDGGVPTPSRH